MIHRQNFLNFFFRLKLWKLASLLRSGLIIVVLIFFNTITTAQESPPEEFVLDASMSYESLFIDPIYNSFIECGFNTMLQRATDSSKSLLEVYNLHALNMKDSTDWIYYYSSAYYSKWEAEENQDDLNKVGVKHTTGDTATWHDTLCWSTENYSLAPAPDELLMYGPSYHQEKWYRRWLYMSFDELYDKLKYTPRFRMALDVKGNVDPDEDVCKLYVIYSYRRIVNGVPDLTDSTIVLKGPRTLKVSDFQPNGYFDYYYMHNNPDSVWYQYPRRFRDPTDAKLILPSIEGPYYEDKWGRQGVQFWVDWLRNDTLCTMYIDNVEVYDNMGWNDFIDRPEDTADKIKLYTQSYLNWNNIKYWMGGHEPSSIDEYTPIRVIDSLIQEVGAPPLMNVIWPHWTLDLNGEVQLERYYNQVQPDKLFIDFYPIAAAYDVVRPFDLEALRRVFQECHILTQDKGFYYHAQSFGFWKNGDWHTWRFPTIPEYKATVMLALTHGADGLTQAQYNSDEESTNYDGVVGLIGLGPNYEKDTLWYVLRDEIIPRLKGTLGNKLLSLNYSGDYLGLRRYLQEEPDLGFVNTAETVTENYLTLSTTNQNPSPITYHFHAGFFESPNQGDNYHFLLTNLITIGSKWVNVQVSDDESVYFNTRFRNVEPEYNFDTTFTNVFSIDMQFPAGEGYLY